MTTLRFDWQRAKAAQYPGKILNVGCNEDPAQLQAAFGPRVVNCDIEWIDSELHRPNKVDILFDAAKEKWPFDDSSTDLVILGDILEHLLPKDIEAVFREAHRVAPAMAITVPRDERVEVGTKTHPGNPYIYHQTVVTGALLSELFLKTGWQVYEWHTVNYGFVPEGYFVLVHRSS